MASSEQTASQHCIDKTLEGQEGPKIDSEDCEHESELEVIFYPECSQRRKSSRVESDTLQQQRPDLRTSDEVTACFVHSLIAGEWMNQPDGIKQAKRNPKIGNTGNNNDDAYLAEDTVYAVGSGKGKIDGSNSSALRSRHLTKSQLTDMAWNVHMLSKKLGSVCLKLTVRNVFLVTKVKDKSLVRLTRQLTRWLLSTDRDKPYIVWVEDRFETDPDFAAKQLLEEEPAAQGRLKYWTPQLVKDHPHLFDFVITLGGDGTVLYTNWLFQCIVPPVLSFALGSLGFLTKFDYNHYEEIITTAFKRGVLVSLRLRFECTVMRSKPLPEGSPTTSRDLVEELVGEEPEGSQTHTPDKIFDILNDVVVDRGPNPTMSQIELFGDNDHFTTLLADGICVATPTGSTAYNLAAGGSLCHPENPIILVTAICPHTLSFRPIILPDTIVLRIGVPYSARSGSWASFDGRERVELHPGDYVSVSASRYPFASVRPPGRCSEEWVHSISKALNWNSRQKQKGFT